ncbi:MAG: YicC/YloC family endoribonuclease [Myxococcota bacterium]
MTSLHSMTGFGHAESTLCTFPLRIDIKSVNHRYSDIRLHLPSALQSWEVKVRKRLKAELQRGRVEVSVRFGEEQELTQPALNIAMAEHYQTLFSNLQQQLTHPNPTTLSAETLFSLPGVLVSIQPIFSLEDAETDFFETLEHALQALLSMRKQEGKHLQQDLLQRSQHLRSQLQAIQEHAQHIPQQRLERLSNRLQELLEAHALDSARLHQEAALISDRSDISEEITRSHSHIQQLHILLQQGGTVGRQIDFLCQELLRESNTMGVKAQETAIFQELLPFKVEIEKVREQAQNIE